MDSTKRLFNAVQHGDVDRAKAHLDEGDDPNLRSNSGLMPLHTAAELGHHEVAGLLVDYGADPDGKEDTGSTPLHFAVLHGRHEVVQLLLDRWANPNARNNAGSTPSHIVKDENISRLLSGQGPEADYYHRQATTPMFPITINGNNLDQAIRPAAKASETSYILIQSRARLTPRQRQRLNRAGVELHDYASRNTYVCGYKGIDLDEIREIEPIVYVDVYRAQLKISLDLRESPMGLDREIRLDITLHQGVNSESESLKALLVEKSGAEAKDIYCCPQKVQLTARGSTLEDLAAIDEVRRIEEAGEIELMNDKARLVLLENSPGSSQNPDPAQHAAYQGDGQVIAIADTGLDGGLTSPVHQAFGNRVVAIHAHHGHARDVHGHGTHVCSSAVGDGEFDMITRVTGTAPRAKLVVQSLWDDVSSCMLLSGDLSTQLFNPPYQNERVRVHSNSWSTTIRGVLQPMYSAAAREIDEFVWNQKEMVICFAAGNDRVHRTTATLGGAAAAKNCITVGASENERPSVRITYNDIMSDVPADIGSEYIARDPSRVAHFSASGPTRQDSEFRTRIKPDVVAPGTHVLSARSSEARDPQMLKWPGHNKLWCYQSGTSMATPLVAGCVAILREVLDQRGIVPTAALVKALLINGADILPDDRRLNPGYSHRSGFGRVNLANSITIAKGHMQGTGILEEELSDYGVNQIFGKISAVPDCTRLKITLAWSDPPGDVIRNPLSLGLRSDGSGSKYPRTGFNNVQQVLWEDVPQEELTLWVRARYLDVSPQPFAVVWRFY